MVWDFWIAGAKATSPNERGYDTMLNTTIQKLPESQNVNYLSDSGGRLDSALQVFDSQYILDDFPGVMLWLP